MSTTRWWWIRHAPVINPEGRIYGQRDVAADLSDDTAFTTQARRLPADAVWITTQLRRTQATASALRARRPDLHAGGEPAVEPALVEQNFGDWQGRSYAEIGAYGHGGADKPGHRFWLAPAHATPPGGESFVDVMARVAAAIERLGAAHRGRDIVVVAHGGTIRAALARALHLEPEVALAFTIDTLSLTRLDWIETPGAGHGWRIGPINLPAR